MFWSMSRLSCQAIIHILGHSLLIRMIIPKATYCFFRIHEVSIYMVATSAHTSFLWSLPLGLLSIIRNTVGGNGPTVNSDSFFRS